MDSDYRVRRVNNHGFLNRAIHTRIALLIHPNEITPMTDPEFEQIAHRIDPQSTLIRTWALDPVIERRMVDQHRWFVDQAIATLSAS